MHWLAGPPTRVAMLCLPVQQIQRQNLNIKKTLEVVPKLLNLDKRSVTTFGKISPFLLLFKAGGNFLVKVAKQNGYL